MPIDDILTDAQDPTWAIFLAAGADDLGNAECVAAATGDRYLATDAFGWLSYTGTHWQADGAEMALETDIAATLKRRRLAAVRAEAENIVRCSAPTARHVRDCKAMLRPMRFARASEFDACPDMLNVANGVLNLRTGELVPHAPAQRFTYCAPVAYRPDADQAAWVDFLTGAAGVDQAEWLRPAVGYTLTAHTREEVLFYLWGPPRAGKGIFLEVMKAMLGVPLASVISFGTLTAARDVDSQNFALAPLAASRLVIASESAQYERLNEAVVKALTGGDSIKAAHKYHAPFDFRPKFKIWLSSNSPIVADPDDDAVWGRLRIVEFPNGHLGQEDKLMKGRMLAPAMLEGVLAWAVQGAQEWYGMGSRGLTESPAGVTVKYEMREALDNVGAWLDERCELGKHHFATSQALYTSYAEYCKSTGAEPKRTRSFSLSLQRKGFKLDRQRVDGALCRGYFGLKVNL